MIKFFKYHHGKKTISSNKLTKFIQKTLIIKDPRAVNNWRVFLCRIDWLSPNAIGPWEIKLKDYSLYELLGEDPTGIYNPDGKFILEAQNILNAKPAVKDDSHTKIRRI